MASAVDVLDTSSYDMKDDSTKSGEDFEDGTDIRDRAYNLCKEYLKGRWQTVPKKDFKVTPLGGGLTNKLYVCRIPQPTEGEEDNCPTTAVMRIYGLIIQDFNAQIQESVIFSILSERNIGPKLYAVFPGGRLEEYIECRTLSTQDLPDPHLSQCIAIRLASYHMMVMPVNKQPTTVMDKLQSYHENLRNVRFDDDDEKHSMLMRYLQYDIDKEIQFLKTLIRDTDAPVVFCHNDVQEGNLLDTCQPDAKGNPIQMIDFEYSCYNYRGFDIGNHFCEWMYDYSHPKWPFFACKPENYPTKDQQELFVKSYLRRISEISDVTGEKWQLDCIVAEANRFALLSHLFWSLWSVIQAKMSDIGFGYMEYALVRMEAYYELKKTIE